MAIECYYAQCAHHGTNDTPPDEGPFCHQRECLATPAQLTRWACEKRLTDRGYNLADLDRDNPYSQYVEPD
jgi:hypothetical protein